MFQQPQAPAGTLQDEIQRIVPAILTTWFQQGRCSQQEAGILGNEVATQFSNIVNTIRQQYPGGVDANIVANAITTLLANMLQMVRNQMAQQQQQQPGMMFNGPMQQFPQQQPSMFGGGGGMLFQNGMQQRPMMQQQQGFVRPQQAFGGMGLFGQQSAGPGSMYSTGEKPVLQDVAPRPRMQHQVVEQMMRAQPQQQQQPSQPIRQMFQTQEDTLPLPEKIMEAPTAKETFVVEANDCKTESSVMVFVTGQEKVLHKIRVNGSVVLNKHSIIDFIEGLNDVNTAAEMVAMEHSIFHTCECAAATFKLAFQAIKDKIGVRKNGDFGGIQALIRQLKQSPATLTPFFTNLVLNNINKHFELGVAASNRYRNLTGTVDAFADVLLLAGLVPSTDPKVIADLRPWIENPEWKAAFDNLCNKAIREFILGMEIVDTSSTAGKEIASQVMKLQLSEDLDRMWHYARFETDLMKARAAKGSTDELEAAVTAFNSMMNEVTIVAVRGVTIVTPMAPTGSVNMTKTGLQNSGVIDMPVTEFDHMLTAALDGMVNNGVFNIIMNPTPAIVFYGRGGTNTEGGITIVPVG